MEDSDVETDVAGGHMDLQATKSSSPVMSASKSAKEVTSGSESMNENMASLKVNSHGEIKTNRYS